MRTLTIKTKFDSNQIYEEMMDNLSSYNLEITLNNDCIVFNIAENELIYIDFLSHKLATHIVENIQPRIVREEILLEFSGYLDDSVEELIKRIIWKLLYKNENAVSDQVSILKKQIKEFISQDNYLNLDGFIKFRLNDKKK